MDDCPCTLDVASEPRSLGIGYAGGDLLLVYVPAYDVVVAIAVTGGITSEDRLRDAMDLVQLVARDRHQVDDPPDSPSDA